MAGPTNFCSLAGALQHLTFTRPDIAFVVERICLHMHDPSEPHLDALKRILRYVRGTLHLDLLLRPSAQTKLVVYSKGGMSRYTQVHLGLCRVLG